MNVNDPCMLYLYEMQDNSSRALIDGQRETVNKQRAKGNSLLAMSKQCLKGNS